MPSIDERVKRIPEFYSGSIKTIVVTGGAGFLGSYVVERLIAKEYKVLVPRSATYDLRRRDSVLRMYDDMRPDIVIHLAGKTFVPSSWDDPVGFFQTNLNGTINALEYCRQRKAKLIFISSYLYGNPKVIPITEQAQVQPNNPYMQSKKMAEDACHFYYQYFGVPVTILRPFNIYGPGQGYKFLIPSIIRQILDSDTVSVKDLSPKRDYLYIEDFVDAIICAIAFPGKCETYNIASGFSYSVKEIIDIVADITKKNISIISDEIGRPHEIMDTRANINKAKAELGWHPRWIIKEGLKELINLENNECEL